jgi:hypothetical protein
MKNRVNTFLRNLSSSSSIFPHEMGRKRFPDNENIKEVGILSNCEDVNNLEKNEECDKIEELSMRTFSVKNKRCLILDGSQCNTVKMFLNCEKHSRTFEDIIVPNYCSSTFNLIRASKLCTPYLGSVRAYLDDYCMNDTVKFKRNTVDGKSCDADGVQDSDGRMSKVDNNNIDYNSISNDSNSSSNSNSNIKNGKNSIDNNNNNNNNNKFGFIYLDYCCRLNAGFKSVEKNPIKDIQCLFEYGLFDVHYKNDKSDNENNRNDDNNNDNNNAKNDSGHNEYDSNDSGNNNNCHYNNNNNGSNIMNDDVDNNLKEKDKKEIKKSVSVSVLAICLCQDEVKDDGTEQNTNVKVDVEVEDTDHYNSHQITKNKMNQKNFKKRKFSNLKTFSDSKNISDGSKESKNDLKNIVFDAASKYGYKVEVHPERLGLI